MIPDFKTYIGESVWADIHKRSNGSKDRKEDDIDLMNSEELGEYIKKNYVTNSPFDIVFDKNFDDGCLIITIYKWRNKYCYFRLHKKDGINHVELTDLYNKNMQELVSGYYYLYDDFEKEIYEIFPKDVKRIGGLFPHYDKISNSFFIEVLDFLIKIADNSHIPQIRKKEKTFESVWADIHRRSNGEQVRKEDDINNLDYKEFFDYIYINYWPTEFNNGEIIHQFPSYSKSEIWKIQIPVETHIKIGGSSRITPPITINANKSTGKLVSLLLSSDLTKTYPEILDICEFDYDKFHIPHIVPQKGELTNQFCVDVIDKILSIVKKPLFYRKTHK